MPGNFNFECTFSNDSSNDGVDGTIRNIKYGSDNDNDNDNDDDDDNYNIFDSSENKPGLLLNDKLL